MDGIIFVLISYRYMHTLNNANVLTWGEFGKATTRERSPTDYM